MRRHSPNAGAPRYRYMHLATHGFFDPPAADPRRPVEDLLAFDQSRDRRTCGRNPLVLSGLVLANANRSPAQGGLSAEEVADLDLRGAELVVLSASASSTRRSTAGFARPDLSVRERPKITWPFLDTITCPLFMLEGKANGHT